MCQHLCVFSPPQKNICNAPNAGMDDLFECLSSLCGSSSRPVIPAEAYSIENFKL